MSLSFIVLVGSLWLATPFEDTQRRFSLDLPEGWSFAPQPGDLKGAAFRKSLEGIPANAGVQVMPADRTTDLQTLVQAITAAYAQEPGYRLLADELDQLAGVPAVRRRFVVYIKGDPKWPKMVEERICIVGTTAYLVHVETVADAFGSFEKDFLRMFATFSPGPLRRTESVGASVASDEAAALVGRWEGGGHSLQLSPSGVVLLDAIPGSYKLDKGFLVLTLENRQVVLQYTLKGNILQISGGRFGEGQELKRRP